MNRVAWAVYDALVGLAVWTVLAPLAWLQASRGRAPFEHLRERLAWSPSDVTRGRQLVIVHAVSAGEMVAAGAFVEQLASRHPDWPVMLTCGTREGRHVAERLQRQVGAVEAVSYLPWDRADAVQRWLRSMAPRALVVVEPEFWPNLFRCCHRLQVPLVVLNARVYPRDVWRYRLVRRFLRDMLSAPAALLARNAADVDALIAIGAPHNRLTIGGDLKIDAAARPPATSGSSTLLARRSYPLLLGGSTHPREEELLLRTMARVRTRSPAVRLMLAPRDISRAAAIVTAARRHGLRTVRFSEAAGDSATWDVLVVDRFGELPSLYRTADIALVGGTLVRRGGHNVLEPAAAGCAIVVGPHVAHVRHTVEGLAAAGGIVRLPRASVISLTAAIGALLDDPDQRRALANRARGYVAAHVGSARRSVDALERVVGQTSAAAAQVSAGARSPATPETWRLDANATGL